MDYNYSSPSRKVKKLLPSYGEAIAYAEKYGGMAYSHPKKRRK
jgi:hypothetical protein